MTSTMILAHGEAFLRCPYNDSHQITNAKIMYHSERCLRNYLKGLSSVDQKKVMRICRHNATHHLPYPEMAFHEERCEDAFSVIRHLAYHNSEEGEKAYEERRKQDLINRLKLPTPSASKGSADIKPSFSNNWEVEEEDWESEANSYQPGYDPEIKLKTELVMYNPGGLTKSERRQFRKEVREKAADLACDVKNVEFPTAAKFDIKPDIKELHLQDYGEVGKESDQEDNPSDNESSGRDPDYKKSRRDPEPGTTSTSKRDRNSDNKYYPSSSSKDKDRNRDYYSSDRDRNQHRSSGSYDHDRDSRDRFSSRYSRNDNYRSRNQPIPPATTSRISKDIADPQVATGAE